MKRQPQSSCRASSPPAIEFNDCVHSDARPEGHSAQQNKTSPPSSTTNPSKVTGALPCTTGRAKFIKSPRLRTGRLKSSTTLHEVRTAQTSAFVRQHKDNHRATQHTKKIQNPTKPPKKLKLKTFVCSHTDTFLVLFGQPGEHFSNGASRSFSLVMSTSTVSTAPHRLRQTHIVFV